jgi:hypothetical protein
MSHKTSAHERARGMSHKTSAHERARGMSHEPAPTNGGAG